MGRGSVNLTEDRLTGFVSICRSPNACVSYAARLSASRNPRTHMSQKKIQVQDFEQSMRELEALVERLEQGDLPLEDALKQFERGVALTRACQTALKAAEQKVEILMKASNTDEGEPVIEDFEPES